MACHPSRLGHSSMVGAQRAHTNQEGDSFRSAQMSPPRLPLPTQAKEAAIAEAQRRVEEVQHHQAAEAQKFTERARAAVRLATVDLNNAKVRNVTNRAAAPLQSAAAAASARGGDGTPPTAALALKKALFVPPAQQCGRIA